MSITKQINASGQKFAISVKEEFSTLGIGISGTYSGTLAITGIVDYNTPPVIMTLYAPDGSTTAISGSPQNLFVDVAGYQEVWITSSSWVSGTANISVTPSSAPSITTGASGGGGGGGSGTTYAFALIPVIDSVGVTGIRREVYQASSVTVTYETFAGAAWTPTGTVTLYSPDGSILTSLLTATNGVDSLGNPLPSTFNSLSPTYSYNGSNQLTTEVRVYNTTTYTKTYTWTGNNLTNVSMWVPTP